MSDDEQKQEELEAQVDELMASVKARSQNFAEQSQDLDAEIKGQMAGLDQDFNLMVKEVEIAEGEASNKLNKVTDSFLAE